MKRLLLILARLFWCGVGFAASSKSIKAIENCADDTWEKRKRDYRTAYIGSLEDLNKDIAAAREKGDDEALIKAKILKASGFYSDMSKEEYNKLMIWETTYIKQPLKYKLKDTYIYEQWFRDCEAYRSNAPITFDEKWK